MQNEFSIVVTFAVVTTLLIILLVAFCLSIIILYKKKQSIHYKTLQNVQLEYEKLLLQAQLQIQEETFTNISREIHDNISQVISLAKGKIGHLLHTSHPNNNDLIKSDELLNEALLDLKDVSRSLSSDLVRKNGLAKTLEFEVNRIRSSSTCINLLVTGDEIQLPSEKELILFRITQEALSNAIKYASALNINIELRYTRDELVVTISDDGKGFDVAKTHNEIDEKSGLLNMKTRTKLLNGIFDIQSKLSQGTTINISIPLINSYVQNSSGR